MIPEGRAPDPVDQGARATHGLRELAGRLAVGLLRGVGRLPLPLAFALGAALLPFYRPFRRATRARLRRLGLSSRAYYRARLRLALLSLRHLLGKPDGLTVRVEGEALYQAALATGRAVVIVGWHQGPVELLHRVPSAACGRRPFFVMTAGAFSPVLAALMADGRGAEGAQDPKAAHGPKRVIRPDSLGGLRAWERDRGVLAVMVDQVRGRPEEWLSATPGEGADAAVAHFPWPKRLLEWVLDRRPEILSVTVQLEGRVARFRYEAVDPERFKTDVRARMETALRDHPLHYNWSYPKIRVR